MSGHGEKLSRKQEAAILALLQEPTLAAAARACGVGEATLARWLRLPPFQAEYRAARRQVVEHALSQLQQLSSEAAATLRRNLSCGLPSVEVRAALGVLDQALRAVELLDLAERVAALEERAAATEPTRRGRWSA
jgi:hypothetical protein